VALFDRLAPRYDGWYQTPLGALTDVLEREEVLDLAGEVDSRLALDASCGTGNYALALARRGARVTAVDASALMLVLAQAKARRERLSLALVRASLERLPFRPGHFDLVTCVLALEFVADPAEAVAELFRVQPPDGRLVLGALGRFSLWALGRRLKALVRPSLWWRARFFSRQELAGLLSGAGYGKVVGREAIFFPPFRSASLLAELRRLDRSVMVRIKPGHYPEQVVNDILASPEKWAELLKKVENYGLLAQCARLA
jgi:ubiquinone/menaquinone biosynthesis C-methylase UbiE